MSASGALSDLSSATVRVYIKFPRYYRIRHVKNANAAATMTLTEVRTGQRQIDFSSGPQYSLYCCHQKRISSSKTIN